jgi:hypothetical protein
VPPLLGDHLVINAFRQCDLFVAHVGLIPPALLTHSLAIAPIALASSQSKANARELGWPRRGRGIA